MNADKYIETMRNRLISAFDLKDKPADLNLPIKVWAEHNRLSEKYFLAKKISLYAFQNDEYVGLIDCPNGISREEIEKYVGESKRYISTLKKNEEHMSSVYTLAFISSKPITQDVADFVKKTKFHKDFLFTLRGWADLALLAVDLQNMEIYANRQGKKSMQFYEISEKE